MTTLLATSAAPTIHVPHIDYLSILPMLIMLGGALLLMLVSSLLRKILDVRAGTVIAVVVSTAALVAALVQWDHVATHGPSVTIAGAIAFGVAYNVSRIALADRSRDLATLRVLGFGQLECAYILLGELIFLALLATPLGVLGGLGMAEALVAALG